MAAQGGEGWSPGQSELTAGYLPAVIDDARSFTASGRQHSTPGRRLVYYIAITSEDCISEGSLLRSAHRVQIG